jgi:pilus assembly protein Flp/PilA
MLKKLYVKAKNLFTHKEEGATMVEYGLMVALIAAVCIGVVTLIGTDLKSLFTTVGTAVTTANTSATTGAGS